MVVKTKPETVKKIKALLKKGLSEREVARKLKKSRGAINYWRHKK